MLTTRLPFFTHIYRNLHIVPHSLYIPTCSNLLYANPYRFITLPHAHDVFLVFPYTFNIFHCMVPMQFLCSSTQPLYSFARWQCGVPILHTTLSHPHLCMATQPPLFYLKEFGYNNHVSRGSISYYVPFSANNVYKRGVSGANLSYLTSL